MAEHIQAQLVGPVQVFEDDQHRGAGLHGDEQVGQLLHQQPAPVVRITSVGGDCTHPRRQAPAEVAQSRLACGHQAAGQI